MFTSQSAANNRKRFSFYFKVMQFCELSFINGVTGILLTCCGFYITCMNQQMVKPHLSGISALFIQFAFVANVIEIINSIINGNHEIT